MIGVDTNVLARYLLNDDAKQGKAAFAQLSSDAERNVPVSKIPGLVWVLRVNDCSNNDIRRGLRHLLGLPNFSVSKTAAILHAVQWFEGVARISSR